MDDSVFLDETKVFHQAEVRDTAHTPTHIRHHQDEIYSVGGVVCGYGKKEAPCPVYLISDRSI